MVRIGFSVLSKKGGCQELPRFALGCALGAALLLVPAGAPAQSPDQVGQWSPVLNWGRQAKHSVLLPTGNALIWSTGDNAFVWDTSTTSPFTPVPFLATDLHCAAQATLADGKVIVIGGVNVTPHIGTPVCALFDPFTSTWTQGRPMTYSRWYGTATTLPDGRLLASNGDDQNQNRVLVPEIYDPTANTWTVLTGASREQILYSFMHVLPDGRVYESGAKDKTAFLSLGGTGSWNLNGPTNSFGSSGYAESCAMYGTGKILRAGGGDP